MRRILLLLSLLILTASRSIAQQLTITVLEQPGDIPVQGMTVQIGDVRAQTNEAGKAVLDIAHYPATVEVKGISFETTRQKVKHAGDINVHVVKQQNSLQETVVTGVARPQKLQNAFSQYRVITRAENLAQGNMTLADALMTRLNISVDNDPLLGTNTKVQGMSGNKVKILIDGLPVNGREAGNIDMGQLSLNNVDRIEIVQGPMSVVYGSDALGGVINLITRKTTKPWEASAGLNYESVGKYNADVSLSRKWKKHQLLLGGGRNYFAGWQEADTSSNVPHRRLIWKPKEQYLANATYNYTAASGFKAQWATDYTREKITNKGDAIVTPYEGYGFDEYYRTTRLNNRLILDNKIGKNGHWESRNSYAIYYRTKERVTKDLTTLQETPTTGIGDQDTSRYDDINLRGNYSNVLKRLKYDAGYDIALQQGRSGKIPGGTRHIDDYALYQNFSRSFMKKEQLTLQASFRESYNTEFAPPLIYSLQALYSPMKKVQIRASFANGFRAPTLKEQYLDFVDQNHKIFGNPNLKAERGNHAQASVSYQLYERNNDYVQLIATGFYNEVYNQIALAQKAAPADTNEYIYTNFTKLQNALFNLQLEQQWKSLHLVVEYGYTHTYAQPGYDAYNASEITARLNYYWKWSGLTFNTFYKFTGARANVVEGIDGIATSNGRLDPYHRLDASLEHKFWKRKIQVIAGVKNIFDVQTVSGTGIVANGGAHSITNGGFLPRSIFTTLRLNLN